MKKFLLMVTMACVLISCSPSNVDANGDSISTLDFLKFKLDEYYSYIVDKDTGVVYLEYDYYYRHALTVMLNTDGTPVTAEELGIKY
jgi:hypothetical protein